MGTPTKPTKPVLRDFAVYLFTSVRMLLLKGHVRLFCKDVISFFRWRQFRVTNKSTVYYQIPWMSFAAIDFLKKWLHQNMIVFEYGSGGSTLFIASRVQQLYSVDHDEAWFNEVKQVLAEKQIQNVSYQLHKPLMHAFVQGEDCSHPDNYLSCMGEFRNQRFEAYVKSIDQYQADYFDLVIVDGRARPSCVKHALQKVKKGGVLLIDNADRDYYTRHFPMLQNPTEWQKRMFIGHFPYCPASILDTTILFTRQ